MQCIHGIAISLATICGLTTVSLILSGSLAMYIRRERSFVSVDFETTTMIKFIVVSNTNMLQTIIRAGVEYTTNAALFPVLILAIRLHTLFLESLGNSSPVDDIPNSAKVLSLAVLVLQVVGVLPGVDSQKRLQVAGDGVLVGASDEAEVSGRLVLDEPGPAGALDAGEGGVGLLLEVVEGGKVLLDGGLYIPLVS